VVRLLARGKKMCVRERRATRLIAMPAQVVSNLPRRSSFCFHVGNIPSWWSHTKAPKDARSPSCWTFLRVVLDLLGAIAALFSCSSAVCTLFAAPLP
jgi:hypothetical protein